ncbi:MAG: LysM peptidoglycan-binding domain-containing protein [Proteobacteria bacterium]|nr:LysM peptidoglycan-binding domain-containing protein [Pseudomonadota bacterium]
MMVLTLLSLAFANDFRVVGEGDTVESIAEPMADVDAAMIRALNKLEDGEQPIIGMLLQLPELDEHAHQTGYVIALTGTGTLTEPSAAASPLALGAELPAGSTVCTGTGSFATIRLAADGATGGHDDVSLLDDTCVSIRGLSTRPTSRSTTLDLGQGSLSVRAAESLGRMNIVTRDGITTGELGGFRVTLEEEASRTEALYAPVAILGAQTEREVPAGFGGRVSKGEKPTELTPLLPPGKPIRPANGSPLRRHDFAWTAVDRALGFRIEFSTAPDFSELVVVEEIGAVSWKPDFLALPQPARAWWWRISSIDRLGYVGIPSDEQQINEPLPTH